MHSARQKNYTKYANSIKNSMSNNSLTFFCLSSLKRLYISCRSLNVRDKILSRESYRESLYVQ